MKRTISDYFLFLFLLSVFIPNSYSQTAWFPFSSSTDQNPLVQLLSFDTKSAIIEITLQGLAVEEKIEKSKRIDYN